MQLFNYSSNNFLILTSIKLLFCWKTAGST